MNIETIYAPGDDFVILRVSCAPLQDKNIAVSVDALVSGLITLEDEIEAARVDGEARLNRANVINSLLGSQDQGRIE
jgi:hypothetical protein